MRDIRDETNERLRSLNEGISEEAGSPFVSMPAIPAVYLAGDGENQPLEKVYLSPFQYLGFPVEYFSEL